MKRKCNSPFHILKKSCFSINIFKFSLLLSVLYATHIFIAPLRSNYTFKPPIYVREKELNETLPFEIVYREETGQRIIRYKHIVERDVIGNILEYLDLRSGVEVGVQRGEYSVVLLSRWPSCERFILVDIWMQQTNYQDIANVVQKQQDKIYSTAISNVRPWSKKIEICRNFSERCAGSYSPLSLDFAYIDARHDFKGVFSDLEAWYSKVRVGGIMAGHDYMDLYNLKRIDPNGNQNWSVQSDGSLDTGMQSVKGAVNLFFAIKQQYITRPHKKARFGSWLVLKENGDRHINHLLHFMHLRFFGEDFRDSKLFPFSRNVHQWEMRNSEATTIVWTSKLVGNLFPEARTLFETVYKERKELFIEYISLQVLYRFGGVVLNETLFASANIQDLLDVGMGSGQPFVICQELENTLKRIIPKKSCSSKSFLLFGSVKGNQELKSIILQHKMLAFDNESVEEVNGTSFLSTAWNMHNTTSLGLNIPFLCNEMSNNKTCIAWAVK